MRKLRELTKRYSLADLVEVVSKSLEGSNHSTIEPGETAPPVKPEGEKKFVKLHKTEKFTNPDRLGNPSFSGNVKKDTSRAGREPLPGFPPDTGEPYWPPVKESWGVDEHGRFRRLSEQGTHTLEKGESPWKVWKSTRGESGLSWGDFKSAQTDKKVVGNKSSRRLQPGQEIQTGVKKAESPPTPEKKPEAAADVSVPISKPPEAPLSKGEGPSASQPKPSYPTPEPGGRGGAFTKPGGRQTSQPGTIQGPPASQPKPVVPDPNQGGRGAVFVKPESRQSSSPPHPSTSGNIDLSSPAKATGQAAPTPSGPSASGSVNLTGAAKVAGAVGRAMTGQGLAVGQEIGKNFPSVTSAISGAARSLVPGQGVSIGMKLGQKFGKWLGKEETEQLMNHRAAILGSLIRGLEPPLDEAAGVAKLVSKKVDPIIKRPKFDARGNLVLTQKAKQNITQGKKSRKLTGQTYKPSEQKRFGEAKEEEELDEARDREMDVFTGFRSDKGKVKGSPTGRSSKTRQAREKAGPNFRPKSAKERYASNRRRAEMSRKHPELAEDSLDEYTKYSREHALYTKPRKKPTVLISPKGYKGGGKVTRIPKSQYDPKKHSLAEQDATIASRGLSRNRKFDPPSNSMGALTIAPSRERPPGGHKQAPEASASTGPAADLARQDAIAGGQRPQKTSLKGKANITELPTINAEYDSEGNQLDEKNWIQDAIKKPGALTAAAHRAKKSVGEFAREHKHSSGKVGKRARLALTLKGLNKEETQLDELKKATLVSYIKGAKDKLSHTAWQTGEATAQGRRKSAEAWSKSSEKSEKGIERAADRLGGTYKSGKPLKFKIPDDESNKTYSQQKTKLYHKSEYEPEGEMLDEGGPTKKHFQMAADAIKAIPDENKRKEHAAAHADLYAKQNPRFNREKFYQAAGLKKHQYGPNEETELDEVITKSTPVGDVIHDFVHSSNKVFKGDSKKQRIKRALGAYYGKQRGE